MAYTPSLQHIDDIDSDQNQSYLPSMKDLSIDQVQSQPQQAQSSSPSMIQNYANMMLSGSNQPLGNALDYLMNPKKALLKEAGSIGSLLQPELRLGVPFLDPLLAASGRVGAGTAASTAYQMGDQNNQQGLGDSIKKNLTFNTILEGLTTPFRAAGRLAELMSPQKYAGLKAEEIRNNAQAGLAKAQSYYAPVHTKYDNNWLTSDPENYLGFTPEDRQYFKPIVNKAYRDVLAEPTFANFHNLQSKMGQFPELAPMRESVNNKIESYLSNDPEMLQNYQNGRNTMKNEYYPYTANDHLESIATSKRPIAKRDPNKLLKAIQDSPLVQSSNKMIEPIDHPLVNIGNELSNKVQKGLATQSLTALGMGTAPAIASLLTHPDLMTMAASPALGFATKYAEPGFIHLAQNPWITKVFKNQLSPVYYGLGRQGIGSFNQ